MHPTLKELEMLHEKARGISVNGERTPLFIRSDMKFIEGQNNAAPMVFNIPVGEDFYATRLNLYLASRLISISNPDTQSEATFRATDWTSTNDVMFNNVPPVADTYQNKYASCLFEVKTSDGRKFQNAPMSGLHAFSDREPLTIGSNILFDPVLSCFSYYFSPYAAYVGGMDFDVEERIPAGSAWNLIVTPTFSRDVSSTSVDRREFMAVGVLTGHKKIRLKNGPIS